MSSVIQDLLDGVIGDGARSAKFDCEINFGNTWLFHDNEQDIFAMVKTSQFPGKTHETIDLKFKGQYMLTYKLTTDIKELNFLRILLCNISTPNTLRLFIILNFSIFECPQQFLEVSSILIL